MRDLSVQESYIRDYLSGMELDESVISKVLEHNKKYDIVAQQNEEVTRNVVWKIKEAEWDNLFNYGEKNKINFEKLNGLVGIFGRNYSGKSSIVDSLLFTLFNTTSKGERKNVHIVNQNRERAKGKVQIEVGDKTYQICRNIEKYTKRLKGRETQEARIDLDFSLISEDESLNGTTRNETDANIRKRFGTIDDFLLTSMSSQLDSLSFVKEGSTKRKEILAKFLDLEIFDSKFKLAKKDAAEMRGVIKRLQEKQWDKQITKNEEILQEIEEDRQIQNSLCDTLSTQLDAIKQELDIITTQIANIPAEIINIDQVNMLLTQKQRDKTILMKSNLGLFSEIQESKERLSSISEELRSIDLESLKYKKAEYDSIQAQIQKLDQTRSSLLREKSSLEKKMKMLHNHKYDPNCKYCCDNKFVKDAQKASNSLPQVLDQLANLDNMKVDLLSDLRHLDIDSVTDQISKYEDLSRGVETHKRLVETKTLKHSSNVDRSKLLAKEIEDLGLKIKEYEENREAIENLETLLRERTGLESSLSSKEAKLDKCRTKLQNLLVEEGATKQILKSLQEGKAEMEDIEKGWIAYDLFMQCMHPNGIPYTIIKKRLPLLNEEISKVLENIVDFEVFFINNAKNLDIMIKHPSYDPRPLSMGSGAEKTLASMAIRLALISITNLPKSELFILDEPATALDQDHMEGFTNLLRLIKNQFKTVILISHLDSLKDVVDMTIDIQKDNGYANVSI
jgi:DNA repair exonuclease SbcCD ATPase subunit